MIEIYDALDNKHFTDCPAIAWGTAGHHCLEFNMPKFHLAPLEELRHGLCILKNLA